MKATPIPLDRIDLNKLKTFYYVAQEGSYQRAALHLGIKPSYISKHIKSLEEYFKIKLFKRFNRSLILTENGQAFLKSVEVLMNEVQKIEEMGARSEKNEDDTLRIVTTTGAMHFWLIRQLKEYVNFYPQYKIRIITTNDTVDIADPFVDVALLPKIDPHPDIIRKKLISIRTHLYASQKYLNEFGVPETPTDLDKHRLISFYHHEAGHRGNVDWHLNLGVTGKRPRIPFLVINSAMGIFEAVANDMGIGPIPEVFPYIHGSNHVKILEDTWIDVPVYFVTHMKKQHLARVQTLIQFLWRS